MYTFNNISIRRGVNHSISQSFVVPQEVKWFEFAKDKVRKIDLLVLRVEST